MTGILAAMNYGRAFRVLRAMIGWKSIELADRAGYAISTMTHLESVRAYRGAPSKASLANLTQALGATPRLVELLAVEDVGGIDPLELGREVLAFLAAQPPLPKRMTWRERYAVHRAAGLPLPALRTPARTVSATPETSTP